MGTLVKYEHVSGDPGNMQLGQRVYHIDAYWQWNQQEATQLPEAMVVGCAAGWGWHKCRGGANLGSARGNIKLGCHRALLHLSNATSNTTTGMSTISQLIGQLEAET